MRDDHSLRADWVLNSNRTVAPIIHTEFFPCNKPGSGCQDLLYEGPPSCGCPNPYPAGEMGGPQDSCYNCHAMGLPPYVPPQH